MGIPSEAQLIVPKIRPLVFSDTPIICLAGKTGAGKSVVARYLSVFYGFEWIRTRNVIRELLIEDQRASEAKRLFLRSIDVHNITEKDLHDFGAVVLDVHKQKPLRKKLSKVINKRAAPLVVDAIRHTLDLDRNALGKRSAFIWFIDCAESIISQRLEVRLKLGQKRSRTASPVDRTAGLIRNYADAVISNNGSLEELRWHVDDELFAMTNLQICPNTAPLTVGDHKSNE
jgi:dephospho-CoA kinase